MDKNKKNNFKNILFGVSIGDALGVPVEFKSRHELQNRPVTQMEGFGTYAVPAGTFSDDSSLTFCLAEMLTEEFNLNKLAENFINWLNNGYWTATGEVFDVGIGTQDAIYLLEKGFNPLVAGGKDEHSNGNGSLMRILPLIFYIKDKKIEDRYEIIRQVSSLTHGHERSIIACFYYLEFARLLLIEKDKFAIYQNLKSSVTDFLKTIAENEIPIFKRLLEDDIFTLDEKLIQSSGYVIHTLEASIRCILTTENYKDAVLKAVNLGHDTDTTAAVTGGLAGIIYGFENIPTNWINQLARKDDISDLADRLMKKFS